MFIYMYIYILTSASLQVCDMTHSNVCNDSFVRGHDSFICVPWLIHMQHDSFVCVPWPIHVWPDSFVYVSWLLHMRDMTHLYACHDYFICVTWLIHTRAMATWYAWHDLFVCVPWLLHVRDMTTSYAWHDSFVCREVEADVWHDEFIRKRNIRPSFWVWCDSFSQVYVIWLMGLWVYQAMCGLD